MYLFASCFFFFTSPPPSHIYTLSLHDALPISDLLPDGFLRRPGSQVLPTYSGRYRGAEARCADLAAVDRCRSEEHTSELQSRGQLVCRLLLEKKNRRFAVRFFSLQYFKKRDKA